MRLFLFFCALIQAGYAYTINRSGADSKKIRPQRRLYSLDEQHANFLPPSFEEETGRRKVLSGMLVACAAFVSAAEAKASDSRVDMTRRSTTKTNFSMNYTTTGKLSEETTSVDWISIFKRAQTKALGGGKAGAYAAVIQVFSLMWLRTSMNRQYRYGGDLRSSLTALWEEGGIPRLYQGLPFALIQGPLTRFGDTAANVGILTLLESSASTQILPLPLKTALGSIAAGTWRIILMPIDASKTAMQVEGPGGLQRLWSLAVAEGPGALYQGAVAQAAATAVGHFPWFYTYNFLDEQLPLVSASDDLVLSLLRSAFLGFSASCVSDVCSNSLRVIKTTKQTARLGKTDKSKELSYTEVITMILDEGGFQGLFGRGLQTRLLTNSIQGAVFSVLWRYFQQAN